MADIQGVVAAFVVLLLPGLAVTAGLFRGVRLAVAERLAISIGLSLALAVIAGVALAAFGVGLGAWPWLLALAVIIGAGGGLWLWAGAGGWLMGRLRDREFVPLEGPRWTPGSAMRVAGFGLAAVLAVAGVVVARQAALDQAYPPYTAFWVVPAGSGLEVGIRSAEPGPETYRVEIRAGTATVAAWPSVNVAPGQQWTGQAPAPPTTVALEADLYRAGDTTPYRQVTWPLPPAASPAQPAGSPAQPAGSPEQPAASP